MHPSRFEGFGLTVAEAMAAKIPVVVSNVPALLEVVDNGQCGYIFESNDYQSLANIIEKVIRNYDLGIIERAYERVKNTYDVSITARRYLEEYGKVSHSPMV